MRHGGRNAEDEDGDHEQAAQVMSTEKRPRGLNQKTFVAYKKYWYFHFHQKIVCHANYAMAIKSCKLCNGHKIL